MASRLDSIRAPPYQLGVQFLQIGDDEEVTEFLRELDDDLKEHSVRDMVDTTPYTGSMDSALILQACLGAINRRIDGQNSGAR